MPPSPVEPFVIAPGDGFSVANPVGGVTTFKAMAGSSGGAFTALEGVSAPGEGPPLHVHREQDELIYTLDGRLRIRLGEESCDVDAGTFVFIPRGTPHTWQNIGEAAARFVAVLAPSGRPFERFFERYAALPDHERDGAAFARLAAETQAMDVVGPPLA